MSSVDFARPDLAPVFAALGDPTRLSLVDALSDGADRSLSTLSGQTRLTRQAVSKHLRVLESAGLVRCRRAGRESRYTLAPTAMTDARAYLEAVSAHWDAALGRLKLMVETEQDG